MGEPNFWGARWKIGLKIENAPNSGMFSGNISSSPLEYQNLSSYIFLTYTGIHLFVPESPKHLKKLHFCIISKVFPQLRTSPLLFTAPYFWATSSKLTYTLMCSLIVWDQPKFRFNSFILIKVIHEKLEGELAQLPPPPPLALRFCADTAFHRKTKKKPEIFSF